MKRIAWNKGTGIKKYCIDCKILLPISSRYLNKGKIPQRCRKCWKLNLVNFKPHPNSVKALNENRDKVAEISRLRPPRLGIRFTMESKIRISASKQGIPIEEWSGFLKPKNDKIRNSEEYKQWREAVFRRDNWICVMCGKTGRLNADHIKPFSRYPELRLNVSNGRTLCIDCHRQTDTWGKGALRT